MRNLYFTKFKQALGTGKAPIWTTACQNSGGFPACDLCSTFLSVLSSLSSILIVWFSCCNLAKQCGGCGFDSLTVIILALCSVLFFSCLELSSSITLIKALTNKVTHFPFPPPLVVRRLNSRCYKLLEFLFLAAQILASFLHCAAPLSQHQGLRRD